MVRYTKNPYLRKMDKQLNLFDKVNEKPQKSLKEIIIQLDRSKRFVKYVEQNKITLNPFESPEAKIIALKVFGYSALNGPKGGIPLDEEEIIPHSYKIRILGKAFQNTYYRAKNFIKKHNNT